MEECKPLITGALAQFVEKQMGAPYVNEEAFSAAAMYEEGRCRLTLSNLRSKRLELSA